MYQVETKVAGVWTRDTLHTYETTDEGWDAASRVPDDVEGVRLVDVTKAAAPPRKPLAERLRDERAQADAVGVKLEARLDAARAAASAVDATGLEPFGFHTLDGAHLTWVESLVPGDRVEWSTMFGEWIPGVVVPLPPHTPEASAPAVLLDLHGPSGQIVFSQDKRRIRRAVAAPEAEHERTESAARDAHRTNPEDAHKPRPDLIPADALLEVGAVLEWGTRLPGLDPDRWERKSPREHVAAAMRHTLAHLTGATLDTGPHGSGRPHLAHAAARILYALAVHLRAEKRDTEAARGLGL